MLRMSPSDRHFLLSPCEIVLTLALAEMKAARGTVLQAFPSIVC